MNSKISGYGNKRMLLGVLLLLSGIFFLWYWFHPLSPHNERLAYVAVFDEVGPVAKGNNVKVGGIPKGRILHVHKTDSCIYVKFEMTSDFRLPKDSRLHFASAGFLGNRELWVDVGTSPEFFANGDTVLNAVFDKGLNTAREDLNAAMRDLAEVSGAVSGFLDSLKNGFVGKQGRRVVQKGKRLVAEIGRDAESWKGGISQLMEDLSQTADKLEQTLDEMVKQVDSTKNGGEKLVLQLEQLQKSVETLCGTWNEILVQLRSDDNSAGLLLQKGGEVSQKLKSVESDATALLKSVKKNGLPLNVDFF